MKELQGKCYLSELGNFITQPLNRILHVLVLGSLESFLKKELHGRSQNTVPIASTQVAIKGTVQYSMKSVSQAVSQSVRQSVRAVSD